MPRKAKGPRLALRREGDGAVWIIRDGGRYIRTGCREEEDQRAQEALKRYLESKWQAPTGPRQASEMLVADLLVLYAEQHVPHVAAPKRILFAIDALLPFWGARKVADIKGETCRLYVKQREAADSTARYELSQLNSAIRFAHREGFLVDPPAVTKPRAAPPRNRWLTRSEAARLLWAARRNDRLTRYILIGLYTGTRSSAILGLQWVPNMTGGHVDLERGLMFRRSAAKRQTSKRQTPVRLPRKLLLHLRRWRGTTRQWIIERNGHSTSHLYHAWRAACASADLGRDVIPHAMRHTAITWAMQSGARPVDASSFFGVTLAELERTYLHHHPDHQKSVTDAFGG